jgi:hypothetical protein
MSVSSCPRTRQLSWDVPADAGFLYDKAAVLGDTIKGTPVSSRRQCHVINCASVIALHIPHNHIERLQDSLVVEHVSVEVIMAKLRSALFLDITQSRVVILYRRFGRTHRSHLQGSRSQIWTWTS